MSIMSGFFDSVNKDRVYNAEFLAMFHAALVSNGVYPNPSNNLQVLERTNMTTTVKEGKGWINGHFVINTEDFVLQHGMADGLLHRIDRIVLQLDTADRLIDIVLKKGVLATNPQPPALVRNVDFYELVLADVRINAGQVAILQSNITDQRLNKQLCGLVHGYVEQVDTTTIFNQYQSWFSNYSTTKAQEFLVWQNQVVSGLESWIDAQELDFLSFREAEEQLYATWLQGRKNGFDAWFNDIKEQLATVDIGAHITAEMPHRYTDNNKIYKWGFGVQNGIPYIITEEVI